METPPGNGIEPTPLGILETFLRGMETVRQLAFLGIEHPLKPSLEGWKHEDGVYRTKTGWALKPSLEGWKLSIWPRRPRIPLALKPSLEGWKLLGWPRWDQGRPSLETFLRGMETAGQPDALNTGLEP